MPVRVAQAYARQPFPISRACHALRDVAKLGLGPVVDCGHLLDVAHLMPPDSGVGTTGPADAVVVSPQVALGRGGRREDCCAASPGPWSVARSGLDGARLARPAAASL